MSKSNSDRPGPRSFGEALSKGVPIVITGEHTVDKKPEVLCNEGMEREALELLAQMGIIKLTRPIKK